MGGLYSGLSMTCYFPGSIMLIGVIFDIGVWYEAKHLVIFNTDHEDDRSPKKEEIDQPT